MRLAEAGSECDARRLSTGRSIRADLDYVAGSANLSGANLHGVDLLGADLTGADLGWASLMQRNEPTHLLRETWRLLSSSTVRIAAGVVRVGASLKASKRVARHNGSTLGLPGPVEQGAGGAALGRQRTMP